MPDRDTMITPGQAFNLAQTGHHSSSAHARSEPEVQARPEPDVRTRSGPDVHARSEPDVRARSGYYDHARAGIQSGPDRAPHLIRSCPI